MRTVVILTEDTDLAPQLLCDLDVIELPISIHHLLLDAHKGTAVSGENNRVWVEWVLKDGANYEYLWNYGMDVLDEFYHRFGSQFGKGYKHGVAAKLEANSSIIGETTDVVGPLPVTVEASREVYKITAAKVKPPGSTGLEGIWFTYHNRNPPEWLGDWQWAIK